MSFISASKTSLGARYEQAARMHLERQGYEILGANLLFRGGELDLVAHEGKGSALTLVFIEVRKRDSRGFLHPTETITYPKQQSLKRAAELYLLRYRGRAHSIRFDLIAFENEELKHFRDFICF